MGVPKPGIRMGTYLSTEPGYLVITEDGRKSQLAISEILRAIDMPALTYEQVEAIKTLSNLFVVLVRTLIDKGLIGETFMEKHNLNLEDIAHVIEEIGGDYLDPDLTVS